MSTYSSNLRIELITTGTQAGTWGTTTNDNLSTVLEAAVAGSVSVTTASANEALTYLNGPSSTASANSSVRAILTLNTSTGANFAVYAPPVSKLYIIKNASSYTATIYNSTVIGNTTAAGSGVAIPAGKTIAVWSDGTNFVQQVTYLISPELAGTPVAPTASAGTNTTQIATTAFVGTAVSNATGALGTMSTQNANSVAITGGAVAGVTLSGATASSNTFTTGNSIQGLLEKATITASAPTSTTNFDVQTQVVQYYTSNATTNFTLNIRGDGSTSLNSVMSTGQSLTIALLVTVGSTAYIPSTIQIDGSTVTPKWVNGTSPTTAYVSGVVVYALTIVKTASATFTVLGSQTRYA
jgi:hypothetical protein